jgi:GDP-mannose transporter
MAKNDGSNLYSLSRFSRGKRAAVDNKVILPVVDDEKREHGSGKKAGPLLSGTAYCISSCSMILLNKVVLSSYNFNAGVSLMFYQVCYLFVIHLLFLVGCVKSPISGPNMR